MAHERVSSLVACQGCVRTRTRARSQASERRSLRAVLLLSGILAAVGLNGLATGLPIALPGYTLSVSCSGAIPITTPSSARCSENVGGVSGFSSGVAHTGPPPNLGAHAQFDNPIGTGGSFVGQANLDYWFQVVGPPHTFVGVIIDSLLQASTSGEAQAGANLQFNGATFGIACFGSPFACGSLPASDQVSKTVIVSTDFQNEIRIAAIAVADSGGEADASADPFLRIDPSTPNADLFTLVFSAGIINEPSTPPGGVPEPSILVLLIVGLASLLVMRRVGR